MLIIISVQDDDAASKLAAAFASTLNYVDRDYEVSPSAEHGGPPEGGEQHQNPAPQEGDMNVEGDTIVVLDSDEGEQHPAPQYKEEGDMVVILDSDEGEQYPAPQCEEEEEDEEEEDEEEEDMDVVLESDQGQSVGNPDAPWYTKQYTLHTNRPARIAVYRQVRPLPYWELELAKVGMDVVTHTVWLYHFQTACYSPD